MLDLLVEQHGGHMAGGCERRERVRNEVRELVGVGKDIAYLHVIRTLAFTLVKWKDFGIFGGHELI